RRRHTRSKRDWSSDVCSSDLDGSMNVVAYDPHVQMDWVEKDVKKAVADSSLVLVLSDHSEFKQMSDADFSTMKDKNIFDTKNVMTSDFKEVNYYNYGNIQKL